jgi:WD40 repeat protein/energy-coupling factor transporter ATP-binding protein EcfA2
MSLLFISHSSVDHAAALEVQGRLQAQGYEGTFLDFDPINGIPAGRSWENELYSKLRLCGAVILIASRASLGSQWCFAEVCLARSLDKPVFQLSLDGKSRFSLLAAEQTINLLEGDAAHSRLWRGLKAAGLDPADSFLFPSNREVYPGLRSFEAEDAAAFFGRRDEIEQLMDLLHPTLQRESGRVVAIIGPSGSGKSSLLNAGLLPRLKRQDSPWIVVPTMLPGRHPVAALARSLAGAYQQLGVSRDWADIKTAISNGNGALRGVVEDLVGRANDRSRVLLVIDQAEELLTRTGAEERRAFLALVRDCLHADVPVWVVQTARSEFLSTTPERSGLAEALDDSRVVEPLSPDRLPEVIEGPAALVDLRFAPGLVQRMVRDTDTGDGLPLLAYTLRELYQRVGTGGTVRIDDYEALGGVVGALQRRADRVLAELGRRDHGDMVLPTLMRLVTIEGSGEPTGRRIRRESLSATEAVIVDAFVDARLLSSRREPEPDGDSVVGVAHEALLRQWTPLRDAIEASRSSLRMRSELERLTGDWDHGQRDEAYLLRGGRLATFDKWASDHTGDASALELQFLEASRALAVREEVRLRRSNRRLRLTVAGLVGFLVLALVATGIALQVNRGSQAKSRVALARQLGAEAGTIARNEPDTAILLGLQAVSAAHADADRPPPSAGLISGLAALQHESTLLTAHADQVHAVAYSHDGRFAVTGSWDRTVRFWDPRTYQEAGAPIQSPSTVNALAISPDSRLIATGGEDGVVRLWDTASRQQVDTPLNVDGTYLFSVAFSPDGRLIAAGSEAGTVRVWEVATGRLVLGRPFAKLGAEVHRVAFSRDGQLLAAGVYEDDETGSARVWRVRDGSPFGSPLTFKDPVRSVAFPPTGGLLAVAAGKSVRLWDPATGKAVGAPFTGHTDDVLAIAFTKDGQTMATGSVDKRVRLWQVASRSPRGSPLIGHTADVADVAFSTDGGTLLSGSWDTTARAWRVPETFSVSRFLSGHVGEVHGIAFSRSEPLLATSGVDDNTTRLWKLPGGQPHGPPLRGDEYPQRVAFSRDGRLIATAGYGGTVTIWQVAGGRRLRTIQLHDPDENYYVQDVAFSPDGRLLATGDSETQLRFWRVDSGREYGKPLTHLEVVDAVKFSPDGKLVAAGLGDRTVHIWDVKTRQAYGPVLRGHTNGVESVDFSGDGKLLASAGDDRTVRLWTTATGLPHGQPVLAHEDTIWQVAFSPDGQTLATASEMERSNSGGFRTASRSVNSQPTRGHNTGWTSVPTVEPLAPSARTGRSDYGTWDSRNGRLWDADWSGATCQWTEWQQLVPGKDYQRTCAEFPSGPGAPSPAPAATYSN